ncbi:MAG: ATP synthase F1 subunit epsilon [Thermoleophilia bacterium]
MSTAVATDRKRLGVRVLTPEGPVYDGDAYMVIAPSVEGELGILPRHQPIIAFLRPGETRLKLMDDTQVSFATTSGYMSVEHDRVLILVEQAERSEHIDQHRAQDALRRAEEAIVAAGDDAEALTLAESAKRRAENRIRVASGSKNITGH